MGRWYRNPKRLNLKYVLQDSECEFIFDASQTPADEFLELQQSLAPTYPPERLVRESETEASAKRILIVWEDANHLVPSERIQDGWRGVVVIPSDVQQRKEALTVFFQHRLRYRISPPHWASNYRGTIPPFLIDLTKNPATITPAELVTYNVMPRNERTCTK